MNWVHNNILIGRIYNVLFVMTSIYVNKKNNIVLEEYIRPYYSKY